MCILCMFSFYVILWLWTNSITEREQDTYLQIFEHLNMENEKNKETNQRATGSIASKTHSKKQQQQPKNKNIKQRETKNKIKETMWQDLFAFYKS